MKNLSNFIIRLIPPSLMLSLFYFGVIENIQWVNTTFLSLFYLSVSFCTVVYIFRVVLINKVSISDLTYSNINNHLNITQNDYYYAIPVLYNYIILLGLYNYGYYGEVILLICSTVVCRYLIRYTERKTLAMLNIDDVIKCNCKPDQSQKE